MPLRTSQMYRVEIKFRERDNRLRTHRGTYTGTDAVIVAIRNMLKVPGHRVVSATLIHYPLLKK